LLEDGHLFHLDLTSTRREIAVDDPRLADRFADSRFEFNGTETKSCRPGLRCGGEA
jgi:hypothetical protein